MKSVDAHKAVANTPYMPESSKPQTLARRELNGWYAPLRHGRGIDVGAGRVLRPEWRWWDVVGVECDTWDVGDGDAHDLEGISDGAYDWLYSSHLLEHLEEPTRALRSWLRVVKPGGHLLLAVPHRDLYEKRARLPSRFNPRHLRFYLPFESDNPDTVGFYSWLRTLAPVLGFDLLRLETGDWGCTNTREPGHGVGEYQIDALLRKQP